jgi:hypothetical protein
VVSRRDKVRYYNAINVTGEHSDAAKTFLLASSAWWGRVQGCGCGWPGRKGPSRSIYRSALNGPYICFQLMLCCHTTSVQTYEHLQERPASRLSQRSSPTPTNQLGQLQATSHPPTSHIRCVPSAYPFHLQQRQHELRDTLPLLSLPVTCFPHVCQITAGFVSRPVSPCFVILSSSSLSHLSPDTTLQPYHGHPS